MSLTFEEYVVKRILIEEGHHLSNEEIKILVEAGFMDKVKNFGKKAALAGAIGAAGLGVGLNMNQSNQSQGTQNQQTYSQQQSQQQNVEKTNIGGGITKEVVKRQDGTYYIYYRESGSPRMRSGDYSFLRAKATNDFMKSTGMSMQGVEWGQKTVKGNDGIWIKVSHQNVR